MRRFKFVQSQTFCMCTKEIMTCIAYMESPRNGTWKLRLKSNLFADQRTQKIFKNIFLLNPSLLLFLRPKVYQSTYIRWSISEFMSCSLQKISCLSYTSLLKMQSKDTIKNWVKVSKSRDKHKQAFKWRYNANIIIR